ncbi:MAG TPA: MBOAT family protein [Verrucomicrobiota bacterium]|nr:membrane-bound O-acyltransferase family protein [Verrucomicrobiales bacterium]HRI13017.1 MBOAT family protein [Verrucomicrobiota bacterium]
MLFNSYEFLFVFLPLTLLVWHITSRRWGGTTARHALLAASLVFYVTSGVFFLVLLLASIVVNFWVGRWLSGDSGSPTARKFLLGGAIAANLVVLGWFKYAHFIADNLNAVFGVDWVLGRIVLPLGISFHTFQQIGYLVDAHRKLTREYNFWDYSLFVSFFPQLVAGPIVHHADLVPQFKRLRGIGLEAGPAAEGATLFTLGLAKKVLLADALGRNASAVFGAMAAGETVSTSDAWLGLLAYTFQIYFDFSGYSDMAIGLGRFFGVMLPFNFNSPYAADSLVDFWRRWHITLSNFIRDYLYIPLGGNRLGTGRTYLNLLFVMTITGLWHGANWTFVLWGALHGVGLVANHLWRRGRAPAPDRAAWLPWLGTFVFVMLCWVLFRADRLSTAGRFYETLFSFTPNSGGPPIVRERYWIYFALLLPVVRLLPNTQEIVFGVPRTRSIPKFLDALRWKPAGGWAWVLGLLLGGCILSLSNVSEFLYWQF